MKWGILARLVMYGIFLGKMHESSQFIGRKCEFEMGYPRLVMYGLF